MKAMVLHHIQAPLQPTDLPMPQPGAGEILVKVKACALCRTDLHIVDGELPAPKLPLVPGHEVVGRVEATGREVFAFKPGDRVGIPWLGWTCGHCRYCRSGRENLCPKARFTGYTRDGGFAEYLVADARFCLRLPDSYDDNSVAPLLCAGLIGYRSLQKTGNARRLGLYGFGAAAHIITQIARHEKRSVYAFTRPGDTSAQKFARSMGAIWAGGSDTAPPAELDAAILFAPVGELIPVALRAVARGGCVVCGGIHMSPIPAFPYEILWHERTLCSVANLTRQDGRRFMALAGQSPLRTVTQSYPLAEANIAMSALRAGKIEGAAVLQP